ncbi:MAG: helicase C-terminal domain-containing protein [Thermomicrobiaceae bacterium]
MTATYVALDVEATGMDPTRDEVIEIAALKFSEDRIIDRWQSLVRPRGPIPFNIATLTGITTADVESAPRFSEVAPSLEAFVARNPVVGQSPQFDIEMLAGSGLRLKNPRYDTFELATILIPDLPAYNLATIASRLNVQVTSSHRAMADVETTVEVFRALIELLAEYDSGTLDRLSTLAQVSRSPLSRLFSQVRRDMLSGAESGAGLGPLAFALAQASGIGGNRGPETVFLMQRDRPARLEPTGNSTAIDPDRIESWADPGGLLSESFPGFEKRDEQVAMMKAVAHAFNEGEHLLVEAGTGTGKSLAYLLPAIMHAVETGEPVVVSTDTIALQDQLFRKDLPDLKRALSRMAEIEPDLQPLANFHPTVLKGRNNYLCLRRWFLAQRDQLQEPAEASLHAKVLTWIQQTESGDRAELHMSPDEQPHWNRLAEEVGACLPGRCVFQRRNQCFLFRARHAAEGAHVIVVNHSLLLSDMLAENSVLPPYSHLIVDEAHNLEQEATQQLGFSLNRGRMIDLVNRITYVDDGADTGALANLFEALANVENPQVRDLAREIHETLEQCAPQAQSARAQIESFFERLGEFIEEYQEGERGGYDSRLRLTRAVRNDPGWSEVELRWEELSSVLVSLLNYVGTAVRKLDGLTEELPEQDDLVTELDLIVRTGQEMIERGLSTTCEPDSNTIYWLSRHSGSGDVSIQAAPLNVGPTLREKLFDPCDTVVMTSATMTIDQSFDYVRARLGADRAAELQVSSPFNYPESTLLYLAEDLPEPGQQGHQRDMNRAIQELCLATRGRAMVLFTSHNALQNAYRAIKRPLENAGILVLAQRIDGNPRQLVDRLRSHEATVLLGTNSFWEGVDIVGDSLSLLVITKLPFSVPSDPVFAARSEMFDDAFMNYAVPQAVLRFKQGFGRLIRSSTDAGVCAIFDRRITGRGYGSMFINSLPECTVHRGPASDAPAMAAKWLEERHTLASVPAERQLTSDQED